MAKRLHQGSLVLGERKVRVSVSAARKVAEYANRADWHFRRGNEMQARSLLGRAREVLLGCEVPDEGPLRKIFLYVASPPDTIKGADLDNLRDSSMLVLEQIEKAYLEVPDGKVAGGD